MNGKSLDVEKGCELIFPINIRKI